jgi:hypothetical protein
VTVDYTANRTKNACKIGLLQNRMWKCHLAFELLAIDGNTLVEHFTQSPKRKGLNLAHKHLSNIDCLTARTACLVCFSSSVNSRSKIKIKIKEAY